MIGVKAPVVTLTVQFPLFSFRNNGGEALLLLTRTLVYVSKKVNQLYGPSCLN